MDKYLEIANKEKEKRGLNDYVPLYPMLRIDGSNLYIGIMLTHKNEQVWDKDSQIKPNYWLLIDIKNNEILEFNATKNNDFVKSNLINKEIDNKQKEISKYIVSKKLQYKEYLKEDIKNDNLPIQQKLAEVFNNEFIIDGEKININDYVYANMEQDLTQKIDELVDLVVVSKYNYLTLYYDNLFKQIIEEYKNNNYIDKNKIKLCCEIMNNYYDGVIGIDNFFNY